MLEIGNNTYADIDMADDYINQVYRKHHPLRVHWSVLDDEEKESYLIQSVQQIDMLKFSGTRFSFSQKLQFPRTPGGIPTEVENAQIENAIGLIKQECEAVAQKQTQILATQGIVDSTRLQSQNIINKGLANKRMQGMLGTAKDEGSKIASRKAYDMLRGWIGGYRC